MDLLEVVVQPTWKEFLIDLIQSEKMDPWDIDLIQVSDAYLGKVRGLQSLDLRIPANVILASSLLLRFKAEAMEWKVEEPEDYFVDEQALIDEDIPDLIVKPNRPRARRVTLDELVKAVESVMKEGRKIQRLIPSPISINVELPKKTMGERITDVFEKTHALKDADSLVLFSELSEGRTMEFFLPVLHLVNERKLEAWQDSFFGEIFLKVISEELGNTAAHADAEEKLGKAE